ncbi:MAG: 4Fe-4S binding protein [Candidatus Magnetominusculus sp. LBB02]|nr:4Fe-4S binding protein [Candidatus Magnetominusculus sp. LBB02]
MKYLAGVTTLQFDSGRCTGCGMCAEVCPHGVFIISDRVAHITDKDKCMECGACETNCAFEAITVASGVGCASAIINGMITGGEPSCGCNSGDGACC